MLMHLTTSDGISVEAIPINGHAIRAVAYDGAAERILVQFPNGNAAQYDKVDFHVWERIFNATDRDQAVERIVLAHPRTFPRTELGQSAATTSISPILLCGRGCGRRKHRGRCRVVQET